MRARRQFSLLFSVSLFLLVLVVVLSATGPDIVADGTIRYVAPTGTDAGDCTVPGTPCATVQYAVDAAGSGDLVKIAAGLYIGVQSRPAPAGYLGSATVQQVVYVDKTVTLQGGYLAPGFAEPPDPETNQTTLDAQDAGRVLFIAGDVAPHIEGLRLTGGDASGLGGGIESWQDAGGGVYILDAEVTLIGNWVYGNVAEWFGGGLYLWESNSLLEGNVISENEATHRDWGHGGGLALYSSHARFYGNTITANRAWYSGGGLHLSDSDVTMNENLVSGNACSQDGGGLTFLNCDGAYLHGNTISGNEGGLGGGILLRNSDVTMKENTVDGNTAGSGGGLGMMWSRPELDGNSIVRNTVAGSYARGGGLWLSWYSDALLTNNLIAGNVTTTGEHGSALHIEGSSPRLLHNTIVSNTGGLGAISVVDLAAHSSVTLTNTILVSHTLGITVSAGNTATLEATFWGDGVWANDKDWDGDGLIETGATNIWGDPAFTCTGGGCPEPYRLAPESDAIDEGVAAGIWRDIDGQLRPYQAPDLGADEYWPPGVLQSIYLPLVLRNAP